MRGLLLITLMLFSLSYPNISNAKWKVYECDTGIEDLFGKNINRCINTQEVIIHSLNWFKKININFDYICCIYPTAVMIKSPFLRWPGKANRNPKTGADMCQV